MTQSVCIGRAASDICRYTGKRKKLVKLGDVVYVHVLKNGVKIIEKVFNRVESMTDVIAGVRKAAGFYSGLVKVYIRNVSRGWSEERPLMFYDVKKTGHDCQDINRIVVPT